MNGIYNQTLSLLSALYDEGGNQGPHWRSIGSLSEYSADALQLAINRGWLHLDRGQSVCLTDDGRKLIRPMENS